MAKPIKFTPVADDLSLDTPPAPNVENIVEDNSTTAEGNEDMNDETHDMPVTTSTGYKVDDNIAIPKGRERAAKYPWKELKIGQSFFVPGGKLTTFATTCNKQGKSLDRKFIVRSRDENNVKGVRIWRAAS